MNFEHLLWIALTAALLNNIVLVNMLGLCPFVGVRKPDLAAGVGAATVVVLMFAAGFSFLVEQHILPPDWRFIRPLVLITAIALFVQIVELCFRIWLPLLHRRLGIYLPLIVTNCAVLGTALSALSIGDSFAAAVVYGAAGGFGFLAAGMFLACINESIDSLKVPQALRGAPITVVTAGIMSLSVQGFAGLGS